CQVDAGMPDASSPFACGTTKCAGGDFCEDHPPGILPADGGTLSDDYECLPIPAACATTPTCKCIQSTLQVGDPCSPITPGVTCPEDGSGHVEIHCRGE